MFSRIRIAFIIIFSILFLVGCNVFSSNEYSKEDIFRVVNDNVSLVKFSVAEIENFPKGTLVSTVDKYNDNQVEDGIKGLFTMHQDVNNGNRISCENEVLTEMMKIEPIRWISSSDEWVMFDCSPSRFGPSSYGHGFYYSSKNEPKDVLCIMPEDNFKKFKKDENSWSWNEKNGDNSYFTERITDKLFYYEFSF